MKKMIIAVTALTLGLASAQSTNVVDHASFTFGVATPVYFGQNPVVSPVFNLAVTGEKNLGYTRAGNLKLTGQLRALSVFNYGTYDATLQLSGALQPQVTWYTSVTGAYNPYAASSVRAGVGLVFGVPSVVYGVK